MTGSAERGADGRGSLFAPLRFMRDVFAKPTRDEGAERYDTDAPWICWRFLSTDARTRITGRMVVDMDCCVCGQHRKLRLRIPRFGAVVQDGKQ